MRGLVRTDSWEPWKFMHYCTDALHLCQTESVQKEGKKHSFHRTHPKQHPSAYPQKNHTLHRGPQFPHISSGWQPGEQPAAQSAWPSPKPQPKALPSVRGGSPPLSPSLSLCSLTAAMQPHKQRRLLNSLFISHTASFKHPTMHINIPLFIHAPLQPQPFCKESSQLLQKKDRKVTGRSALQRALWRRWCSTLSCTRSDPRSPVGTQRTTNSFLI